MSTGSGRSAASDTPAPNPEIALFGDPRGEFWAILLGGEAPRIALAPVDSDSAATFTPLRLERSDQQTWSLAGERIKLKLEFAPATTFTHEHDGSDLRPCLLSGTAEILGAAAEINLPGVLLDELPSGKVGSVRLVGSWFTDGREVSLLSVRPKDAKGHDADAVDVITRGDHAKLIFDPRLSTTYGPDGSVRRAGVELWLGDDEDGDQHPRRVVGVAAGAQTSAAAGLFKLQAYALRCLSSGEQGTGVYLLASA